MTHPPHLPKKSCSITLHNLWHNMRNIVFFVLLSVGAGITGSLISNAWIEPTSYNASSAFLINHSTDNMYISQEFPDPDISQRIQYGTLRMYERSQKVADTSFFPAQAFLGYAVVISSDGWAVAYMPDAHNIAQRMVAMDYQGISYMIEDSIIDPYTDFVYMKFKGNNFRVMSFVDFDMIRPGVDMWRLAQDGMHRQVIGQAHIPDTNIYSAFDEYYRYEVLPKQNSSGVVMNDQGQFVGFVDTSSQLHSAWTVTHHMTSLLSQGLLDDVRFVLDGYMVEQSASGNNENTAMYGFVVTGKSDIDALLVGDIIISINNNMIVPETFYQKIYSLQTDSMLQVLRDNHKIDILVGGRNSNF